MISSEVRRTLVKSPPELWAELSDPATLGRHLGELGEIRITRIDPEQKVEWETEDTTGTVVITPSGWGTKVTLSVTRESPEPTVTRDSPEPQASIAAEPVLQDHPEPSMRAQPEPSMQAQPEPSMRAQPGPSTQAQPEGRVEQPQPMSEAEPERLVEQPEPVSEAEPELTAKSKPQAVTGSEPQPEVVIAAGEMPASGREPESAGEPELEPRRGFFARLFRRRRVESVRLEPPEPITIAAEPGSLSAVEQSTEHPEDVAVLEQPHESKESLQQGESPASPDAFAAGKQALAPEAFAAAHPFGAGHPSAGRLPTPTPEPPEMDEPVDISAEIKVAEELAAERVTAVLIGVLDRLGAAHHRPFSRA